MYVFLYILFILSLIILSSIFPNSPGVYYPVILL